MKAAKGFEIHIDGQRVKYVAGQDVSDDICKEYKLAEKQLVSLPGGEGADSSSGTSAKTANRKKNVSAKSTTHRHRPTDV